MFVATVRSMENVIPILKQSLIFGECTSTEITKILAPAATEYWFKKNEYILSEGFDSPGIYVIAKGSVKLVSHSDGRQLVVEIDYIHFGVRYLILNLIQAGRHEYARQQDLVYQRRPQFVQ